MRAKWLQAALILWTVNWEIHFGESETWVNLGVKNLGAWPMKLANHRAFFAGNMMFLGGLLDLSLADDCLLQEAWTYSRMHSAQCSSFFIARPFRWAGSIRSRPRASTSANPTGASPPLASVPAAGTPAWQSAGARPWIALGGAGNKDPTAGWGMRKTGRKSPEMPGQGQGWQLWHGWKPSISPPFPQWWRGRSWNRHGSGTTPPNQAGLLSPWHSWQGQKRGLRFRWTNGLLLLVFLPQA